jgi:hypothetical protein
MKAPRGRGSWAFQPYGDHGLIDEEPKFFSGTLTQAKKLAAAFYRDQDLAGDVVIAVLP